MSLSKETNRRIAANSLFPSCFYVALGIVLVEVGATQLHGSVPWVRIPICRTRFVMSSLAVLAGALPCALWIGKSVYPVYFMIAGCLLYIPSVLMYFLVLLSLDRGYRINRA